MDTQEETTGGVPHKKQREKWQRYNRKTKPNKSTSRTTRKNKAAHKQVPMPQPAWVLNAAGATATRSVFLHTWETHEAGDTLHEKSVARGTPGPVDEEKGTRAFRSSSTAVVIAASLKAVSLLCPSPEETRQTIHSNHKTLVTHAQNKNSRARRIS